MPQFIDHRRFSGFADVYRVFGLLTLLLPMLVLANWGCYSYLAADVTVSMGVIEGGYQVLGFVLSAAAIWVGARRRWQEVVNTGLTLFVIFAFPID